MTDLTQSSNGSITKSASKVMFGGIFALMAGLASNVIVAAIYGANADMDAYLTALVIPSYLLMVFYSSLSFILIPAFIEAESNHGEDDAWALVGTFFWLATVSLVVLSVIGSVFSTQVIRATAPGFQTDKAELASRMLSILMFTTPLMGLSTLTAGIQNTRNRFFWPSIAPAFGYVGNIAVVLLFSRSIGPMALAWGYLASTVFQAAITVIPIIRHGWKKVLHIQDPRVIKSIKLMVPLLFLGMLVSLSPVVERYFASVLPDGQIAYMGYANKISSVFVLLLASGIASSIFPSMSRAYTQDGINALFDKYDFGLKLSLAVALPAIAIVSAIAIPMVKLFFERGAFTYRDTLGVSLVIFPIFIGDVLIRMVGNIFQRCYYVLEDTITQTIVAIIFIILYIAFARFFVAKWGYVGLVWASIIRRGLDLIVIWILLLRKFPKQNLGKPLLYIFRYGSTAIGTYICGRVIIMALAGSPVLVQLIISGLVSSAFYLFILYFWDKEIVVSMLEMLGIRYFSKSLSA